MERSEIAVQGSAMLLGGPSDYSTLYKGVHNLLVDGIVELKKVEHYEERCNDFFHQTYQVGLKAIKARVYLCFYFILFSWRARTHKAIRTRSPKDASAKPPMPNDNMYDMRRIHL
jgi:hypothetical protein